MTDIEAAAYLRELRDYSMNEKLVTPASPRGTDIFFTCAFEHAIRALEERAGGEGLWGYRKNPNGSYTPILEGDGDNPMCNASAITCVSLNEVENIICMGCKRSIIGICPYRGHEPENPEKVTCPTLEKLRRLPRYSVGRGTQDVENVNKGETINEKEKE